MKKLLAVVFAVCLACAVAVAQTPPPPPPSTNLPQGQIGFAPIGGTFGAGVDTYFTYSVTSFGELREDNFLFPDVSGELFSGTYQYRFDRFVCPLTVNTNINCNNFSVYADAGAGVARSITSNGQTSVNNVTPVFGTGILYDPTGTGKFTVTLLDVHVADLSFNGIKRWTPVVGGALNIGLGQNQSGTAIKRTLVKQHNEAKRQKLLKQANDARLN